MNRIVEIKRVPITICTYKHLMEEFRLQSIRKNKSMSRRIEEFIISELEKEKKNDN